MKQAIFCKQVTSFSDCFCDEDGEQKQSLASNGKQCYQFASLANNYWITLVSQDKSVRDAPIKKLEDRDRKKMEHLKKKLHTDDEGSN